MHTRPLIAALVFLGSSPTALCGKQASPFTAEGAARGLNYQMMSYPPQNGFYGFGCGFADFDGDGDADIFALGALNGTVGLYENVGGSFVSRSTGSGIASLTSVSSLVTADYDGDGDLDAYISRFYEPAKLLRNDGGFVFTDVSTAAGIDTARLTKGACWGDFDNDGWIDLFTCNYFNLIGGEDVAHNQLWRNQGDGTFVDVGPSFGMDQTGAASLQAVWTDYDRDGDVDLFVANDRGMFPQLLPNQLWRNDGGVLVEAAAAAGVNLQIFAMSATCGDFDGNGYPDLYCTNTTQQVPPLYGDFPLMLSNGDGTFTQAQDLWGVAHPGDTWGWGAAFLDFDNDGRKDLYVCNQFDENSLFRNSGRPPAIDVAVALGIAGPVGPNLASYCIAYGDIDQDGDLDILLNVLGTKLELYINHEGEKRSSVTLRVIGEGPNTAAIGANAELTAGGNTQFAELLAGGNAYLSQHEQCLHFGLGKAATVKNAVVRWPSAGPERSFSNMPANERWTIYPPSALGDADGDGDIDHADRVALCDSFGPVVPGLERLDLDGNFVVDSTDLAAFKSKYESAGLAWCDLNGDGVVNGGDLAIVLGAWASGSPLADVTGDGTVNGPDLAMVLGAWGLRG